MEHVQGPHSREKYNLLAEQFTADKFDAEALAALAKRAGAGYIVFGARHHDGFCLWDTRTTKFDSVHAPASRDLVREYVEAARRAGLRVGLYYSIMSWQFDAIHRGPHEDPKGWEAMVAETHEQVRELMTHYGQIDLLWYDGCVVPGCSEDGIRAKWWRCAGLNAMVRRLQPKILINDRSALAEDFSTPEQELNPPTPGRTWEMCQTIGNFGPGAPAMSTRTSASSSGNWLPAPAMAAIFSSISLPPETAPFPPAKWRPWNPSVAGSP